MKSRYCLQVKINSSMEEKTEKGQQIGQLPKRDVLTGNEQFPSAVTYCFPITNDGAATFGICFI